MNEKQMDVIGLGASTIDVLTLVEHFPGRVVQQALSTMIQGGGPVATAMVAVSRLGGQCRHDRQHRGRLGGWACPAGFPRRGGWNKGD